MSRVGAILFGVGLVVVAAFIWHGNARYAEGQRDIQARWDAANLQAIDDAMRNRKDADLTIPELTDQERAEDRARSPVGKPCRVFDAHDRDCH